MSYVPTDWKAEAACREHPNADIFFTEPSAGASRTVLADYRDALELCSLCPVRDACLNYALDLNLEGIWGGLTTSARRTIYSRPYAPKGTR
jgi:WhiB family redox-sensing transcriptional regulator